MAAGAWAQRSGGPGNPQQLNRYSYVLNNPVKGTDPSGHCFGPVLVWCAVVVGEFVADVIIPTVVGSFVIAGAAQVGQQLGQAHAAEQAEQPKDYDDPVPPDGPLVRQGTDKESASRLGRKAGEAEANGFPHGVSVTTPAANERLADDPRDSSTATRQQVERAGFPVVHTPTRRDPDHHTVVLPKPVTPADAQRFNDVFGRTKRPQ